MTKISEGFQSKILKAAGQATAEEEASCEVSLEEIDSFGNADSIKESYGAIASYNKMLDEKITFINPQLTEVIPFTRENLYLICGYSGNGKSTVAANISHPLWKEGKKTLVISNEEPKQDIQYRIACLELGYNFNDYKKGNMPQDKQIECMKLFPEISKHVKIIDVVFNDGLSTRYEGIVNALEAVKSADYSAVMIDYYQLIQHSIKDSKRGRYDVLNDLRIYMQRYIRKSNIPIVLFAQLHSLGKRNNVDLDSRIKECPVIIEAATVVLEIIPNFEEKSTYFLIKKDRFGLQGEKITCGFEKGKYVEYDEEFKKKVEAIAISKTLKDIEQHGGNDEQSGDVETEREGA